MSMAPASLQPAYSLQPSNSVTQGLLPPQGQSDTPSVPQTSQPIQQTGHPSLASSYTDYTPQIQQAQNALANYQPYSTKHPILSALTNAVGSIQPHGAIGAGISGTPGGVDAIDAGKQAALKQRVELLQGLQQQQQQQATNQFNVSNVGYVAKKLGLPEPPQGAQIDTKSAMDYVQNTGQTNLLQQLQIYNQDLDAYHRKVALATGQFLADKAAGKLSPEQIKSGPDYGDPPKPPESLNPFLDVKSLGPSALSSGQEAAKTGQEGVEKAEQNQTTLQDAAARIKEAQANLARLQQQHEDNLQFHRDDLNRKEQEHQENRMDRIEHYKEIEQNHQNSHEQTLFNAHDKFLEHDAANAENRLKLAQSALHANQTAFQHWIMTNPKYKSHPEKAYQDPAGQAFLSRENQLYSQVSQLENEATKKREAWRQHNANPPGQQFSSGGGGGPAKSATPSKLHGSSRTLNALAKLGIQ